MRCKALPRPAGQPRGRTAALLCRSRPAAGAGRGPPTRWSRALMQEARTADHPFNAGLMLESLVAQAKSTLNSPLNDQSHP